MDDDTSTELLSSIYNHTTGFNDSLVDEDSLVGVSSNNATVSVAAGYCGASLKSFEKSYKHVHGYTSLLVCLFGAQANILNLIVLTRKEMINPTNAILTGLALADLLNMMEYIPYAVYMILPGSKTTYAWALFVLIHSNFSQVCHTISIWLTVTLAIWRYIMVAMHVKCKTLCSMERAKWAIASAYVTSPLLCIPIYLSFSISPFNSPPPTPSPALGQTTTLPINNGTFLSYSTEETANLTVEPTAMDAAATNGDTKYVVNLSELAKDNPLLMTANFWLYRHVPFSFILLFMTFSVVIKIIPCIMLTVVSLRLINSLMEAKRRKDMLLKKRTSAPAVLSGNHAASPGGVRTKNNVRSGAGNNDHECGGSDRTTRMLLAVLLLFLITEFPQGLLGLLSGVLGDAFFKSCYIPLADLMDFVALLNSAINFILYCAMSKKFRDTFSQVFHLNRLVKLVRRRSGRVHSVPTNNHQAATNQCLLPQIPSQPEHENTDV